MALEGTDQQHTVVLQLSPAETLRLVNFCGPMDDYLRQMEKYLDVRIACRGDSLRIVGAPQKVATASKVAQLIYHEAEAETITREHIHLAIHQVNEAEHRQNLSCETPDIKNAIINLRNSQVRARSFNQARYIESLHTHDLNFGIGPAGTGKTYLAVACAVAAIEARRVQRMVLVRPAVEAGERLGFLPGDPAQKVDPYLRPLYDALYDMLDSAQVAKLFDSNRLEVAPLAYMRGRTLKDSFIILDEAQNTTVGQMMMFLTRIGFGSTAVVTGDITQVDLPPGMPSGLEHAATVLRNVEGISFTWFDIDDAVRHPLVIKILNAYQSQQAMSTATQSGDGAPAPHETPVPLMPKCP